MRWRKGEERVPAVKRWSNRIQWLLYAALLSGIFMFSSGCGKKLFPVPPGKLRPETIDDLSARVTAQGVELSWSVPVRNSDGSPLVEIKSFELYRQEKPLADACQGCPPEFGEPLEIPFDAKPEEARKMLYEDRTVRESMYYVYGVRSVKGLLNRSDMSNIVRVAWHSPPSSPQGLEAEPVPGGIRLSWQPPSTWSDGSAVDIPLQYRIFRREEGSERWKQICDTDATVFVDRDARIDRSYSYRVAAIVDYHGTEILGKLASVSNVVPRDFIPPAPPKGLVAVQTGRGIELLWQQNSEIDIAGYRVYRREPGGLITLLNRKPVREPRFIDRDPLETGKYSYWVTAVDNAQPPNESGMSSIVSIQVYGR